MFGLKKRLARATGAISRRSGRGGGTTLPGRILLRTEPEAIARMAADLKRGSTLISATNGKTTTAGLISALMGEAGRDPVHNHAGSNMTWGIATALAEGDGDEGLFEVDEAWLPRVAEQIEPKLVVLGNLFRDQLDRYGELERLADDWAAMIDGMGPETGLILNADDPLVADLGRDRSGTLREGVTYFGIDDASQALPELQHAHDAKGCRRCGAAYTYERAFVGHLGHYSCPNGDSERPAPEVSARQIELQGMDGSRLLIDTPEGELELDLPIPGLYNTYNALAAVAAGIRLGIPLEAIGSGISGMKAVFGRVETIEVEGRRLSILLIKNPAGANEVLRTLALEARNGPIDLWIALNDRIADGRDVSWVWDADFEVIAESVRRITCAGTRAPEIANRLKYAGVDPSRLTIVESIGRSLDSGLAESGDRLFALPTYTALIELRRLLSARGLAEDYWE